MRELWAATLMLVLLTAVGSVLISAAVDKREAYTIAAEARQEARDIAFEQRQREWGCVQPKSFESSVKRTD